MSNLPKYWISGIDIEHEYHTLHLSCAEEASQVVITDEPEQVFKKANKLLNVLNGCYDDPQALSQGSQPLTTEDKVRIFGEGGNHD